MVKRQKGGFRKRLEHTFEMPAGTLYPALRMELSGNRKAVIEGCLRVLQYEPCRIRLLTVGGEVLFEGDELCIAQLEAGCAVVEGRFCTVGFSQL